MLVLGRVTINRKKLRSFAVHLLQISSEMMLQADVVSCLLQNGTTFFGDLGTCRKGYFLGCFVNCFVTLLLFLEEKMTIIIYFLF